jgi:heme/copper-type cytochrome/quinol oxidase subunit 2
MKFFSYSFLAIQIISSIVFVTPRVEAFVAQTPATPALPGVANVIGSPEFQAALQQEQAQTAQAQTQAAARVIPTANAASTYVAPCAGTIEKGICFPTNTGLSSAPVSDIIGSVMFWLLAIVGMIAIIAFVISGMQYLASVGDAKMAEKGKANMLNSIIGVIVALSGLVIIRALETLFTGQSSNF